MLRYLNVKDHFQSLVYCPTDINLADPLTKALPADKYIRIFDSTYDVDVPDDSEELIGCNLMVDLDGDWSFCSLKSVCIGI